MDIDDEDAFLYGDSESVDTAPAAAPGGAVDDVVKNEDHQLVDGISAPDTTIANGLVTGEFKDVNGQPAAAGDNDDDDDDDPYGDPYSPSPEEESTLPVQPATDGAAHVDVSQEEEGEMEDDDDEEDEDDDDDDGLDIVVAAPQRSMDFRNTAVQSAASGQTPNIVVAGFGMNAASLAGKAAPINAASNSKRSATLAGPSSSALPNAINPTDGTPQANALLSETQPVQSDPPLTVSSIADDPSHSAQVRATAAATEPASHLTGETARVLPPSELPPPHAPGSQPVPPNPYAFTLEPPTTRDAESVYEYDMKVMNASGQPWRARGSDLSRWFNYGFDEFTWKRYCDYRKEAIRGLEAMKQIPMGQPLTVEAATLLHIPVPAMSQMATVQGVPSVSGDQSNVNVPGQDQPVTNEQGESTSDQQQPTDPMNPMMQMGFPMNPEQMQQQMMMMQKMMGTNAEGGNNDGSTFNNANNDNAGASVNIMENAANPSSDATMVPGNGTPDMSAMMGMGGMSDMQAMMNMFGMGMPGMGNMGNMNGMQDMSGFQNMAAMNQAMGNFGNNSPVPGMMGMNMGQMGGGMGDAPPNNMETKRGPPGAQQPVPTGPGFHNMRGGFRGRGRGGLAVRGRGGNALPLGPRSLVPNAPKGPKASRHRDSIPEPPKAGLDYGEQPETVAAAAAPATPVAAKPDNPVSGRAPLPSKQELTRAHTPDESTDDDRKHHASPKRESRRTSPVKEEDAGRSAAEPAQDAQSGQDSDNVHSDAKGTRRTKDKEGRDSASRASGGRETRTSSGDKSRSDRAARSSRDDRSSKEEKPRNATRRVSRSRERRRDEDRDKERKSSSRHRRTRSDKEGGGSAADEEEVGKRETRRSTRSDSKNRKRSRSPSAEREAEAPRSRPRRR